MPYVYSTMTDPVTYTFYDLGKDLHTVTNKVHIKGGSNLLNRALHTPLGVATKVTDEELAALKEHPVFKIHQGAGFVRFSENKADPEKVVTREGMETRDGAAPLTPADYDKGKAPKLSTMQTDGDNEE